MRWIAGILVAVLLMASVPLNAGSEADPHAAATAIDKSVVVSVLPCEECDEVMETCVRTACDTGIVPFTIRRTLALVALTTPLPPGTVKASGLNLPPLPPPPKR